MLYMKAFRLYFIVFLFLFCSVGRAQVIVNDPVAVASSLSNSMSEIQQMVAQYNVNMDQLDWMDEVMDYRNGASKILNDMQTFDYMYRSLMRQAKMLEQFGKTLSSMEDRGFDPMVIESLRRRLETGSRSIESMIKHGISIVTDSGLTKGEKIAAAEKYANNIARQSDMMSDGFVAELDLIQSTKSLQEVDNFLMGRPADAGVGDIGVASGSDPLSNSLIESGSFSPVSGQSFVAGSVGFGSGVIRLLLGALLALSVIGVYIRFVRGQPDSESGFIRVFVVAMVALVLFAVLNAVLKIQV